MKKIAPISIYLFSILVFASIVSAQNGVEIIPSSTEIAVFTKETATIDLTIENKQNFDDSFLISTLTIADLSVTIEKYKVDVDAKSFKTIKVSFSPLEEAIERTQIIQFIATSTTNKDVSDSVIIQVKILRKSPVYISELKINKFAFDPEETIEISVSAANTAANPSDEYNLETVIKKGSEIIKTFTNAITGIQSRSATKVVNNYKFDRYALAGIYSVETTLKDKLNNFIDRKSTSFKINEKYKLPTEYTEKTTEIGLLSITITIKVKNDGNIPSPSFLTTESVPIFANDLFDPEVEPISINFTGGRVIYSWLIPPLSPGQEITIKYKFNLWNVWIGLLLIGAAVYVAFRFVFRTSVIKKHRHTGTLTAEKEIPITIEVKNRSINEVKDVLVKDFIPAVVQVVPKFETLKPTITKTSTGTELVWKFDSLKPGEERVLTYRVRPTMEIRGVLRLPHASVKYVNRKNEKKMILSKGLEIKSK